MRINVSIINPPVFEIVEPYYDTPPFPRTALAFLAGHIRQNSKSINTNVIDAKFDKLNFQQTIDKILKFESNVIGITAMTNEITSASVLARKLKKLKPEIIIVVGGVHVSALTEESLYEFPEFDYVVKGEGEDSFLQLLQALEDNLAEINIQGVSYMKNGTFIDNGTSLTLANQDGLIPAWDLFRPAKEYMIQSSRGCPFACNFCMNPGGRIVRPRTVETTLNEIGYLVNNMGAESIYFGDEIFTVKRQRAFEICEGLVERGYHKKMTWWCQTHVNTIDRKIVQAMKASSCKTVGLGIETGDPDTLKQMGKGTSKEKIKKAIKILKDEGLEFNTFFILGQPNETIKSALNTINFAVELNPAIPIFGIMVPYPGTKIWEMAVEGKAGYKLLSKDWSQYNKQVGNALELEGVSRRMLELLQLWGYFKVFLFNFKFIDLFKFIFRYRKEGVSILKIQTERFFKTLVPRL